MKLVKNENCLPMQCATKLLLFEDDATVVLLFLLVLYLLGCFVLETPGAYGFCLLSVVTFD